MSSYLVATSPTPLFNTPKIEQTLSAPSPPVDSKGLFYPLESIALPDTKFTVVQDLSDYICQVETLDYPYGAVYIDRRFTKRATKDTPDRKPILPPKEEILTFLKRAVGLPYLWGGNYQKSMPLLAELYSTPWSLSGVDCSGLLYEATNGATPRNTSKLCSFGALISSIEDVKPLDIIIWPGHVIVVLNEEETIESLHPQGVIISSMKKRLGEIVKTNFQIRRFL